MTDGRRRRDLEEAAPKGSALSNSLPAERGAEPVLVGGPLRHPGDEALPDPGAAMTARGDGGAPSHSLKSPITDTRSALGAQTAK